MTAVAPARLLARVMGVICGLAGGLFAHCLVRLIGPRPNALGSWRRSRPFVFAGLCGLVASGAARASGGLSFGAGYKATRQLLISPDVGGIWTAVWRWLATMSASASGAAGGLFAAGALEVDDSRQR